MARVLGCRGVLRSLTHLIHLDFQSAVASPRLLIDTPAAVAQPSVDIHIHFDQKSAVGVDMRSGLVAFAEDTCQAAVCTPGLASDYWPEDILDVLDGVVDLVPADRAEVAVEYDSELASEPAYPLGVVQHRHSQRLALLATFCYDWLLPHEGRCR